jgi:hypothetical protein
MGLGPRAPQGKPSAGTAEEARDKMSRASVEREQSSRIVDGRIGWRHQKLDRIRGARSQG